MAGEARGDRAAQAAGLTAGSVGQRAAEVAWRVAARGGVVSKPGKAAGGWFVVDIKRKGARPGEAGRGRRAFIEPGLDLPP